MSDIHLHIDADLTEVEEKLDLALYMLRHLLGGQRKMSMELDVLEQKIAPMGSAVDSAVALMEELSAMIRAYADDPARILAVADQLDAKTVALAAAVVANTPSAP